VSKRVAASLKDRYAKGARCCDGRMAENNTTVLRRSHAFSSASTLVTDSLIGQSLDRRIVFLDGRPPLGDALRSWAGTSRGHWEGETLVVETRNFTDRTPSFAGAGNSRDKVVTERFTRTSKGIIEYAARVVDPKTFQDRVELSFPMLLVEAHMADAYLYEEACHEGNYSLRNALSAARKEEETTKK
jgi:hypothetical protein